jgi:excisionase family DNA binding protein
MAMRDVAVSLQVPDSELQALDQLVDALDHDGQLQVLNAGGQAVVVSPKLHSGLADLLRFLKRRHSVEVVPADRELTPNEAADLLNVSRTFVYRLIERGELPCRMVGAHKRIPLDAALTYKETQSARWLTQASHEIASFSEIQGGEIDESYPGRTAT